MRTGRPVVKRSPKALERDIAAMRRLRASLLRDTSLTESATRAAVQSLDRAISELQALSARLCA